MRRKRLTSDEIIPCREQDPNCRTDSGSYSHKSKEAFRVALRKFLDLKHRSRHDEVDKETDCVERSEENELMARGEECSSSFDRRVEDGEVD